MGVVMIKELGMPYMGSKRKLSKKIVDEILNANPNTKYFFDLFGGGGAVSFEALQRTKIQKVHYNELNTGVAELLKKIQKDGVIEEFYQWIDRDTFNKHKLDSDWFGGLCKVVWSFGNNQKKYLFGKDVEPIKKIGHLVSVNKCTKSLNKLSKIMGVNIDSRILDIDTHSIRKKIASFSKNRCFGLQQLQQLQRLEQLEQLQQLEIHNKSYNDIMIDTPIDETIIYLDPPYEKTEEYAEGGFDHRELEDWIEISPYKIYVSSYDFNLPKIASFKHRSSLSATANNEVTENLYCNKEHKDLTRLF